MPFHFMEDFINSPASRHAEHIIEGSVSIFVRQILQLVPLQQLRWPHSDVLRKVKSQQFIWTECFSTQDGKALPPVRYRYQIVKTLIKNLESSIEDSEEDEILDSLGDSLSELMAEPLPSEADAAQQRSWVTYSLAPRQHLASMEPIRLLERRSVISGAGTTGLRTWEAALHLGSYLVSAPDASRWVRGKTILELGAGTGFLSILCQRLAAAKVIATDGSEEIVSAVKENFALNSGKEALGAGMLRWGWSLRDGILTDLLQAGTLDTVVGADVTYDQSVIPALIATIRHVFEVWPHADVLISATVRNEDTYSAFTRACESNHFEVEIVDHPLIPFEEQIDLFYEPTIRFQIVHIRAGAMYNNPFALD